MKITKKLVALAVLIVVWASFTIFTIWNMKERGYTVEKVQKILSDHRQSFNARTFDRYAPPPAKFPRSYSTSVMLFAISPDFFVWAGAWLSLIVFCIIVLLAIYIIKSAMNEKGAKEKGVGDHH